MSSSHLLTHRFRLLSFFRLDHTIRVITRGFIQGWDWGSWVLTIKPFSQTNSIPETLIGLTRSTLVVPRIFLCSPYFLLFYHTTTFVPNLIIIGVRLLTTVGDLQSSPLLTQEGSSEVFFGRDDRVTKNRGILKTRGLNTL